MAFDARCRQDQVEACRAAVRSDSLSTFDNGGICEPNDYHIYDHLCALNYYTSGVDYCCCAHGRDALCCRFYYDHKYFRCVEEHDFIDVPLSTDSPGLPGDGTSGNSESGLFHSATTTILIISGVVFAILAVIIIAIVIKCIRARRATGSKCCKPCCHSGMTCDKENGPAVAVPEAVPLTTPPPSAPSTSASGDGNNNSGDVRPQPSAPSEEQCQRQQQQIPVPPSYHRAISEPSRVQPEPLHGSDHPMFRENSERGPRMRTISEAPPAYDDHHLDPPIHVNMNGDNVTSQRPSDWY